VLQHHQENVLELVVFKTNDGATPDQLLQTVDAVSDWLKTQPGFISRDLSYAEKEDRWIDIIRWRTLQDAEAASEASMSSVELAPMLALIDMDSMLFLHGTPVVAPVLR
jgi:hypothetical protein